MDVNESDLASESQAEETKDPLQIADLVQRMLEQMGEDPEREGLLKTPERVSKAMAFLTSGYRSSVGDAINGAVFEEKYDEMVIVKNIEFYSLCEHHLLPFFGVVHVGYIPNGKVLGISKLPRLVEVFARRLQLQERMTQQIAKSLMEFLEPLGVGVVAEAQHLCMLMRGVQKEQARALTSAMLGSFRKSQQTRSEFLSLIGHSSLK